MKDGLTNLERHLREGPTSPGAEAFNKIASEPLKAASVDDSIYESAEDARNRRVAELLRRRQPSGLATGSASPTPPRDSS